MLRSRGYSDVAEALVGVKSLGGKITCSGPLDLPDSQSYSSHRWAPRWFAWHREAGHNTSWDANKLETLSGHHEMDNKAPPWTGH